MLAQVTDIPKKSTVSLDAAAGMVAEQVRSTGKPWVECARMFLRAKDSPTLSRSDLIDAAAMGLAGHAGRLDKRAHTADSKEVGIVSAEELAKRAVLALQRTLRGADGLKPFAEFDTRDRAVFSRQQRERGDGYYRLANFIDKAESLCKRHKVKVVKDLPMDTLIGLVKEVPW